MKRFLIITAFFGLLGILLPLGQASYLDFQPTYSKKIVEKPQKTTPYRITGSRYINPDYPYNDRRRLSSYRKDTPYEFTYSDPDSRALLRAKARQAYPERQTSSSSYTSSTLQRTPFGIYPTGSSYYRSAEESLALSALVPTKIEASSSSKVSKTRGRRSTTIQKFYNRATVQTTPVLTLKPLPIDLDFTQGKTLSTKIFQIGLRNPEVRKSLDLTPVYELRKISWKLVDREGIFLNFSDFYIDIEGSRAFFAGDGSMTTSLSGIRVPGGESRDIEVRFGVRDDTVLPRRSGSLRLVIGDIVVAPEFSSTQAKYRVSGQTTSNNISWYPYAQISPGKIPVFQVLPRVQIFGKNLSAGSSEKVLALRLEANYDEMRIRSITLRDSLSGGQIDAWTSGIQAINEATGQVIGSAIFSGGKAKISFSPELQIDRGSTLSLSFRLTIRSSTDSIPVSGEFKLAVAPADIEAYGVANGRSVTASAEVVSDTFTVSGGGGGVSLSHGIQPAIAASSSPNPIYRFTVSNTGRSYIYLARVTAEINPQELEFDEGSATVDDFLLTQNVGGQEYHIGFTPSVLGPTLVQFTNNQGGITIPPGQTFTFTIQAALNDLPGSSPAVSVRLLGDSTFTQGTLFELTSGSSNFVWSDDSAKPHSATSRDWFSGYRFQGLPTNAVVNR